MKLKVLLILIVLIFLLAGCADYSLPVYEMEGNFDDEDIRVTIDGVTYEVDYETKWYLRVGEEVLGYAGSKNILMSSVLNDDERNFILISEWRKSWTTYHILLKRTDIILPEPSRDSISRIECSVSDFRGEEPIRFTNTITEPEIIDRLFDIWENGERLEDATGFKDITVGFSCLSNDVPGAQYFLGFEIHESKLMCGSLYEGYVKIPLDLFEDIVGREIEIDELLSD